MKVLVDTPVWSLAFRKSSKPEDPVVAELRELIGEMRVVMIGPIRQELLSGISNEARYSQLRESLGAFEDIPLVTGHYEYAALLSNTCRKKGVQGSHTDFLICSVAIKNGFSIFTLDRDFNNYRKHLDISLHKARENPRHVTRQ